MTPAVLEFFRELRQFRADHTREPISLLTEAGIRTALYEMVQHHRHDRKASQVLEDPHYVISYLALNFMRRTEGTPIIGWEACPEAYDWAEAVIAGYVEELTQPRS